MEGPHQMLRKSSLVMQNKVQEFPNINVDSVSKHNFSGEIKVHVVSDYMDIYLY